MVIPVVKYLAGLGARKNVGIVIAAVLMVGVIGGWTIAATDSAAVEHSSAFETIRKSETNRPPAEFKPNLTGSYIVTGTDSNGKPYGSAGILDIALAPSGALELGWDHGKQLGVGQVIGNVLAVACLTKGRTAILIMDINPDGSLSGKWSRRTDRGFKGSETWKRI
jgi:hypothetical protein